MVQTDGQTSTQDGGTSRYTVPPHTTKRRTIINLKTTPPPQNCQKIKWYGSLTTKELKKKHSFRLVGGAAGEEKTLARQWLADWAVPHLCANEPGGKGTGN